MTDSVPMECRYSKSHEWVMKANDGTITIGITDHAQDALGDLVFIDLPELETEIKAGEEFGVIESVKAASDLYAPISGEVIDVNENVMTDPSLINKDPYGDGWILKVKADDESEIDSLLTSDEYSALLEEEE